MNKIKGFFSKCGKFIKEKAGKIAMMAGVPALTLSDVPEAMAEGGVDTSTMVESIKGFFSDFTVANLVTIIGAALGLAVVLFLFWFGYRFIKRAVVKALTKGKI